MKVTIKDFQSLKSTSVLVEGLTVLVGPSHRGKSAFIRAVEGALFNRPGDQFVREGASKAVVVVEDLPSVTGESVNITWMKGKGTNDYVVNGTPYGRVGQGAPPPIEEAGYRDVWIGDKERKKGSYIRPQVATQFEPLFLLTQTGSFISDVLSVISRHAVLLTAQGRCGSDLKGTKQLLGVRRGDHQVEVTKLGTLDDVPAFVARVEVLIAEARKVEAARAAVERLRGLVARRKACLALAGVAVPPLTEVTGPVEGLRIRVDTTARLARTRPLLVHALAQSLPEATEVRADLGVDAMTGRVLAVKRGLLLKVIRPLPTTPLEEVPEVLDQTVQARGQVTGLVERRRRLLDTAARQLPTAYSEKVPRVEPWQRKADELSRLTGIRIMHLTALQRTEAAHRSAGTEAEATEAELQTLLDTLDICPLCEQEMPHVHAVSESAAR